MAEDTGSVIVSIEDFISTSFDYLVLGGGTAGLVVAGRLAENPNIKVGVIEAGRDTRNDPLVTMPLGMSQMWELPQYDWNFYTAPQKYNQNKRHHMVRGKQLGGSSALNAMMYVRGSEADYDSWAEVVGDDGWNSKSMMKYMRKHEVRTP
jgi:choline dehydrogenase-like flavoprotein